MTIPNDSALAHLRDLMPIAEFAAKYPTVYASHDPRAVLSEQHVVYVDVRPAAWPVDEPQHVVPTRELIRQGVVVGLLDGDMAIVGYKKAVYRHLKDEAAVRLVLPGTRESLAKQAIADSERLSGVARRLRAVVA
ncbi:MAG: hypothetical protein FJZ01_27680 [Candidatus Sericytochromatia bacterium]|nr:hypothetical protein [Candidatus Tanganyikabacteria bacterium]